MENICDKISKFRNITTNSFKPKTDDVEHFVKYLIANKTWGNVSIEVINFMGEPIKRVTKEITNQTL